MRSKKAQGELITTVLIILVIIAAVSIVAGVIFTLLNKGKSTIESSSACWGVSLEVVSATPESGNCTYTGTCGVLSNVPKGRGTNNASNCPPTNGACTLVTTANAWVKDPTWGNANIVIKRNAGATGTLVSPVLLINGSIITTVNPSRNNLSELDQINYANSALVLAKGDEVQAGVKLFPSGVACNTILSGTLQAG
jgi:hypothetical protein